MIRIQGEEDFEQSLTDFLEEHTPALQQSEVHLSCMHGDADADRPSRLRWQLVVTEEEQNLESHRIYALFEQLVEGKMEV